MSLEIEKATAGGRMLARHDGQIVFVTGTIPGERVDALVTRVAKGVVYADAIRIVTASADRRDAPGDPRCGGNVLGHITPARQVQLKADIIADAFRRVAKVPIETPEVVASPERGYRMRARLHAVDGRLGFLRESSHTLCDVAATGQLAADTNAWVEAANTTLRTRGLCDIEAVEIAEDMAGTQRGVHVELTSDAVPAAYAWLSDGLSGLSAQRHDAPEVVQLAGQATIEDTVQVSSPAGAATLVLRREVRAFFQGNRYLLEPLVGHVAGLVPDGPVVDLYAGVGLFGLALAALGHPAVTLVEGDRISGASLVDNAAGFERGVQVQRMSVEQFLRADRIARRRETVIVDPPRTGLSPEALSGLLARSPSDLVYVSCDVATLARDIRALLNDGYELSGLRGFDLFPNTAHIECVARLHRSHATR